LTPTMNVYRYNPSDDDKFLGKVTTALTVNRQETLNLLFLLAAPDDYSAFAGPNKTLGAAAWKTTASSLTTGEFLNPFNSTGRTVADLLRRSPREFLNWASNSPVIDKLPLTELMPDWVERAHRRLGHCRVSPDDVMFGNDVITDVSAAKDVLAKFM